MDQILLGLGAAGAALLIIAIAVAVWEHLRHIAEMRQQLAWSENTRDLLQAHAKDVDARLATLTAAVHAQRLTSLAAGPPPVNVPAQPAASSTVAAPAKVAPRASSKLGIAAATAQAGAAAAALATVPSVAPAQWVETEPMVLTSQVFTPETHWPRMPDFDPTMPAELSEH